MEKNKEERKKINLEQFIGIYVKSSVDSLVNQKQPFSLNDWEEDLRKKVSLETGLSKEQVVFLHNPFHWAFFSSNSKEFSPFELEYGKGRDSKLYAKIKEKGLTPEKIERMIDYICKKYGKDCLRAKFLDINNPLL